MTDQHYYDIVARELQNREIRPGLWTRAVAETANEGTAAKALYIRLRVAELKEQELANQRRAEAERKRVDEEARQKREEAELQLKRQREAEALLRQEKERQDQAEIAAQQRKRDAREASEPYTPWLAFGCLVIAIALILWFSRVFAK